MPARIKYEKFKSQREFHDDVTTPILLFSGGLGSGKTYSLNMKILQLSYLNKNIPGGYLIPDYPSFKKDVYPEMVGILEKNKVRYNYHQLDKTFHFPWTKAPLYIFTAEKPIAGPNLGYCGINEYSLIQWTRVNEMLRRVRVKKSPYLQRALAGTPEDVHGWLEEFVEKQTEKKRLRIIYGDTRDNTYLDDDYYDHLASTLDPHALRVFATGEIVRIGGDYFYYSFDSKKVINERCIYKPSQRVHAAMDFNVGRMCTSFAHLAGDEIQFFDELLLTGNSDTWAMALAIVNKFVDTDQNDTEEEWFRPQRGQDYTEEEWFKLPLTRRQIMLSNILITCDASGKNRKTSGVSDIGILEDFGFETRYRRANPRLRARQLLMNGLFSKSKIKAHPKCKNLLKDWRIVQQNKSDYTKIEDKDKKLTHFSDGADYLIDFEYTLDIERHSTQSQF